MRLVSRARCLFISFAAVLALAATFVSAQQQPGASIQAPAGVGGQGAPGRGRGLPGATAEQTQAVVDMNGALTSFTAAVTTARSEVVVATFAEVRNAAAVRAAIDTLRTAELALATKRADEFAKIQAGPNRLTPEQVNALAPAGATVVPGRGGPGAARPSAVTSTPLFQGSRSGPAPALNATPPGGMNVGIFPGITERQLFFYQQTLNIDFQLVDLAVTNARSEATRASFATPRDDAAIKAAVTKLADAESAAAAKKADSVAKIQAGPNKLNAARRAALIANGGRYSAGNGMGGGNASVILPTDFRDHDGYVSLFDGVSLKGWDGNPRFWRVENGAIVGESTAANPSGNSYIMYRDIEAHDFTLKMDIKVEGTGGSGIQYRSKTNIPWLANIGAGVANNNGPVNLDWMTTGPQADFWPTAVHTGQAYSENTPMRIEVRRGFVGEGYGYGPRRHVGTVGDPAALQSLIKLNDWNEYTVVARGPVQIHIINGATMAVMIDDDPKSSNNWSGQIGVELEAIGKISFRNVWLKKIN